MYKSISRNQQMVFGAVAAWHSQQSTGSTGEIPGHLYQSMNRGRGKHLCRIYKQNQSWLRGAAEPDSGILGLQAGEGVTIEYLHYQSNVAMDTKELKKLAEKYTPDQLEFCIRQQLEKGENQCEIVDQADEVITALSKAEVVRELMDKGMKFSDALRELGRRIRAVYGNEEEDVKIDPSTDGHRL